MTYPTTRGVLALCGDADQARTAAHSLAGSGLATSVTLHTAVAGHSGDFMAVVRAEGPAAELSRELGPVASGGLYETAFRRVKAHPQTWAIGEQTPGIGMLFALMGLAGLDRQAVDDHWHHTHASLALRHHPGMWDYVQCSFVAPLADTSPPYCGMAICKFATVADYKERFFDSDEGKAVIRADVAKFADVGASPTMRMVEQSLVTAR